MSDNLDTAMLTCAQLLPKHEEQRFGIFTRFDDGLDIPPSTHVEVIVRLVHDDRQVTPELAMEMETA